MSNRIGSGRVLEAHFGLESAFAGGGSQSASTLIKALNESSVAFLDRARHDNDESTGSRDKNKQVAGKYQPIEASIVHYMRLQPNGSTASVLDSLLKAALGDTTIRQTPSGKTVGASSTTQVIKVTTGTDFALFDVVVIENQAAIVGKVESAQITLLTPLTAAPTTGASITSTKVYHLAQELPTVWADFLLDHTVIKSVGGVIKSLTIAHAAEDIIKLTFAAEFARQTVTGSTALSSPVSSSGATTFSLDNSKAFEIGSVFDVGTEIGITVTAVNYSASTITVTRGASPATHSSGDACTPTWTSGTVTGAIAHGKGGKVRRGDGTAAISIPAVSRNIGLDNAAKIVNDEDGSDYGSYKIEGDRAISNDRDIHFRQDDIKFLRDAQNELSAAEIYQSTNSDSTRGFAVGFPDTELVIPSITQGEMINLKQTTTVGIAKDSTGNEVIDRAMVVATW